MFDPRRQQADVVKQPANQPTSKGLVAPSAISARKCAPWPTKSNFHDIFRIRHAARIDLGDPTFFLVIPHR